MAHSPVDQGCLAGSTKHDKALAGRQTGPAPPSQRITARRAVQARLPGACSARPVQGLALPRRSQQGEALQLNSVFGPNI
ncbi:MAG: hypothetical protein JRI48_10910 [Deltaproteobacteria bacterium]|nr:hypothetical protein [Deltaproteobacteria bacterium]